MSTKVRSKTAQKEFDKFISRLPWKFLNSFSTYYNAQLFLYNRLGIPNCGCTVGCGVNPFNVEHFYVSGDKLDAEERKELARLRKEYVSAKDPDGDEFFYKYEALKDTYAFLYKIPGFSDPNVIISKDSDAYEFFNEPSSLALEAIEHYKELGKGMEVLHTSTTGRSNYLTIVRLTGDGWVNNEPLSTDNPFMKAAEEESVSFDDYEDLNKVMDLFTIRKDPIEFQPPRQPYDHDRDSLTCYAIWIPATDETIQITAIPKEGIVHKNCELFSSLGHFLKYPHSLKEGRKLTDSITDPLTDFQREALRVIDTTDGNIPGAVVDINEQVQEALEKLELLKKTQEFLAAGDFSVIELAALDQIAQCSKLVAHPKLDKRIKDIAKIILTMK